MTLLCLAALFLFRDFHQDDAYISMRYAANLLSGEGLVWNPGERVEGYTNFLHVMALALLGFRWPDSTRCGGLIENSGKLI